MELLWNETATGENQKFTVKFEPNDIEITVEKGANLLQSAINAGVLINSVCDGCGICATCKVLIKAGHPEFTKTDKLTEAEYREGYVQACQSRVIADIIVALPEYQPGLDLEAGVIPCHDACPAGIDVPLYVYLTGEGKYQEALAIIREKVPFPGVLGRVCTHPCEEACQRGKLDKPVSIKNIKRFVADRDTSEWQQFSKQLPPTGKKVAIVGSGPAGLTAGYYLAKLGHSTTIFEALSKAGGMMRVGIPDYRLPPDILDAEINEIQQAGVDIKLNRQIESIYELFGQGYQAVFLAMGAQLSKKLEIDGGGLDGVLWGLDFLKEASLNRPPKLKERVLVIGGGNVAIDAALTAHRLGAREVELVCLESRQEMPANEEEIQQAFDEGVKFNLCCGPKRIRGDNGQVNGIELISCVSVFDKKGRFNPSFDETVTKSIETDTIIFATGQTADLSFLPSEIRTSAQGTIVVDPDTLETNRKGVFAGGDTTAGPASVIEAIAAGRKAAVAIDKYIGGEGNIDEGLTEERQIGLYTTTDQARGKMPCLAVGNRKGNFDEVELGLDEQLATKEAKRCFQCGVRLENAPGPLPKGFTF